MPRKRILAANWKENPPPQGWEDPNSPYRPRKDIDVLVFPMDKDISRCVELGLNVGGQWAGGKSGMTMEGLQELGCTYVLCGHSDRRNAQGERDEQIKTQVDAALTVGLIPILCVGESAQERDAGRAEEVVQEQLIAFRDGSIIAYEPIWAIGSGKTPSNEDIESMHAMIRTKVPKDTIILYGGSTKPENAAMIFSSTGVDGALVGGASLKPDDFRKLAEMLYRKK